MKKKIIVSALTLIAGFSLVGSITSTIAWYQYSTKTTAALVGVAGGSKGNLQMRIKKANQADDEGWTTKITKEEMATYLGAKTIVPVTGGIEDRNDPAPAKLYCNPLYGYAAQTSWKQAVAANYIAIPLELRFHEVNASGEANLAKDIYLSDLFLAQDEGDTTHEDISSAVRFHVAAYSDPADKTNRLISKNGGSIDTWGTLDLNGDSEVDKTYTKKSDKYGFTGGEGTEIKYGFVEGNDITNKQTSYSATTNGTLPILADIANGVNKTSSTLLGTTLVDDDAFLSVDITIWVEGWQKLPEGNGGKAIWDVADFAGAKFDVGFEFEADL